VIERRTSRGKYTVVARVKADTTSYKCKLPFIPGEFWYRVRACNMMGYSDYSNEANIGVLRQ